ncbi:MAG: hypothetical protein ACRCUS_07390 [Anaerovoracaceae bacterium]
MNKIKIVALTIVAIAVFGGTISTKVTKSFIEKEKKRKNDLSLKI